MDTVESIRSWVSTHKLTSIVFFVYERMHAQAFTLTVLSGAVAYHYYDKSCRKQEEAASA
ncbi:hypothetical protein Goari_003305 [Gossypium aridum]|uniref:HIG1 domain-containing protein n=1 Tax=Gossypium aridum TaxID=34290 RepID=A0A7J8YCQ8_GOSAI|nr:hypothetical protein [Gossypium aridum]